MSDEMSSSSYFIPYLMFILFLLQGDLVLSDLGLAEKRVYHAALNGNCLPRVLHPKDE